MLAPQIMAVQFLPCKLCSAMYFFIPATASAPAGSTMLRFSSNTSLTAAHTSSLLQVTTFGSTTAPDPSLLGRRTTSKGNSPICATATPSTNKPTCGRRTRSPDSNAALRQAAPSGSTAMTLTCGATSPKKAATPEIRPPPPTATNT